MSKEGLKDLLYIPQVVEIIKKCVLSSKTDIKKMMNVEQRNEIIANVVNKIPIREDEKNKIYQTSKYTILNNGAYYVHHDWDKK